MTHNDSVQQIKKTCMGPVVSVVVLVELSGMCWKWEHATIVGHCIRYVFVNLYVVSQKEH